MTQPATRILSILILALGAGLAALWLKPDGSLRNTLWTPPEPVMPDLQFADPLPVSASKVDVGLFVATLERPLFSPNRRPPPPPPPPDKDDKAAEPDPFADIHLFGLYGGEGSPSGMLARIGGKVKRVSLDDKVGSWTLKRIEDREAVFDKNGEERKLRLVVAKPAQPPKPAPGAPRAPGAPGAAEKSADEPTMPTGSPAQRSEQLQKMIEQRQRSMRRR